MFIVKDILSTIDQEYDPTSNLSEVAISSIDLDTATEEELELDYLKELFY